MSCPIRPGASDTALEDAKSRVIGRNRRVLHRTVQIPSTNLDIFHTASRHLCSSKSAMPDLLKLHGFCIAQTLVHACGRQEISFEVGSNLVHTPRGHLQAFGPEGIFLHPRPWRSFNMIGGIYRLNIDAGILYRVIINVVVSSKCSGQI